MGYAGVAVDGVEIPHLELVVMQMVLLVSYY